MLTVCFIENSKILVEHFGSISETNTKEYLHAIIDRIRLNNNGSICIVSANKTGGSAYAYGIGYKILDNYAIAYLFFDAGKIFYSEYYNGNYITKEVSLSSF